MLVRVHVDGVKVPWVQGSMNPRVDGSKGRYGLKTGLLQL